MSKLSTQKVPFWPADVHVLVRMKMVHIWTHKLDDPEKHCSKQNSLSLILIIGCKYKKS